MVAYRARLTRVGLVTRFARRSGWLSARLTRLLCPSYWVWRSGCSRGTSGLVQMGVDAEAREIQGRQQQRGLQQREKGLDRLSKACRPKGVSSVSRLPNWKFACRPTNWSTRCSSRFRNGWPFRRS